MKVDNYELLELIVREEERESFNARDLSNSRYVIVHVLRSPPASPHVKPDLTQLARSLFTGSHPAELLFVGEHGGKFYVVTELRSECYDIRKWLEQQSRTNLTSKSADDPLGRAGLWKAPPVKAPVRSEPGEFTQLFQAPAAESELGAEPEAEASQGIPLSRSDAGEFTRLFQTAPAPEEHEVDRSKTAPEVLGSRRAEPGDFTRLFAPSAGSTPLKEDIPQAQVPDWEKPGIIPFENTLPATPPNSEILLPRQSTSEAATGIFTTRPSGEMPTTHQEPPGPSEFTRVIAVSPHAQDASQAAVHTPQTSNTASSSPRTQAKTSAPSYLPFILIMNGLFLAALALIIYFVLKK